MNRIEKKFSELRTRGRKALSIYLTAGYPTLQATEKLVLELERCGVDLFEIGFPFSDPIADGPTIQKSSSFALNRGLHWKDVLKLCANIRKKSDVPLILMSYANPLFVRGWEKSIHEAASAGYDGIIIPDLIPDENPELPALFHKRGVSLIYLVAPTSTDDRIKNICRHSSGFVYCVSVTGVTGARKKLPDDEIRSFAKRIKKLSDLPILLGFGISEPRQIKKFSAVVDGFIVGSAIIKVMGKKSGMNHLIDRAKNFIIPFVRRVRSKGANHK